MVVERNPAQRYRTLAVVKQESVTRIEKPLDDAVFVWPHLLAREFLAAMMVTMIVLGVSLVADAPLRELANPNLTPNPAKAPWYFLGLQELLHYFPPTIAGVLLPTLLLVGMAVLPYIDRNPSRAYADRKLSIIVFTFIIVMQALIIIFGSFFRGPGWSWVWPIGPGGHLYFDL